MVGSAVSNHQSTYETCCTLPRAGVVSGWADFQEHSLLRAAKWLSSTSLTTGAVAALLIAGALGHSSALAQSLDGSASGAQAIAQEANRTVNKWRGHVAYGLSPGSNGSLGQMEAFFPLSQTSNSLIYMDARMGASSFGDRFGNWGLGVRNIINSDLLVGAFAFLDATQTESGQKHYGITVGAEVLSVGQDVRINVHIPTSGKRELAGSVSGGTTTLGIVNHQLIDTTTGTFELSEVPLYHLDIEAGVKLDLQLPESHSLRLFGSAYHSWADGVDSTSGARARLEYRIEDVLDFSGSQFNFGAKISYDTYRGTEYGASARLRIPFGASSDESARAAAASLSAIERRMSERISRVSQIQTREQQISVAGSTALAIDDRTGNPFGLIYFADGANTAGAGDEADPTTLNDALTQSGVNGIIVAQGGNGNLTTGGLSLLDGQQLLGGGTDLVVRTGSGTMNFTVGTTNGVISSGATVISLANNNRIENVTIQDGPIGITGTNITNVTILNSTIYGATNGIQIADTTGAAASTITIENSTITSGGASTALFVETTNAASDVRLRLNGNTFSSNGSLALEIDGDVAGARRITVEQFSGNTVNNSAGVSSGIQIEGVVFDSDLTTAGAQAVAGGNTVLGTTAARLTGNGLYLTNVEGTLSFADLDIANDSGTGLLVVNSKANNFTLNVDTGGAASATIDTTNGTALNLDPLSVNMVFASVNSSGGTSGVILDAVDGSVVINGGAISGTTGVAFDVNAGTVSATYAGNITQTANAAAVTVRGGHSGGTITFQTGTISATNGTGLQFNNADGTYNFNGTTTLNGGDAGIDIINGSSGNFTFGSGASIDDPTGVAFNVDSSTGGDIAYNGTINRTSAVTAITVNGKTGGTVSFGGLVTASTSTANAINLTNNTGGTINFSGGLALTTTTAVGFNATGGGTVNTSGSANNITSGTGIAVNIVNTTIGSAGVTLRSVNSTGGTNGIVLNNTGAGGFTITGDGSTLGSGGTIQNTTDSGISATNVGSVTLNNLNLTNANSVDANGTCTTTDFSGCNGALMLKTVTTVTIDNLRLDGSEEHGIFGQRVGTLELTNSVVTNAGDVDDEHGILFVNTVNGTNASLTVRDSALTDNRDKGIAIYGTGGGNFALTVTGSNLSGAQQNAAIDMNLTGASEGTFTISGNSALGVTHQMGGTTHAAIQLTARGSGNFSGTIADNTVIGSATETGHGIIIQSYDSKRGIVSIRGNTILSDATGVPFTYGVTIQSRDASNFDITIQNNTITMTNGTYPAAVDLISGSSTATTLTPSTAQLCANISGNTATGNGNNIYSVTQWVGAVFELQGLGTTATNAATVETFLQGTDTGSPTVLVATLTDTVINYTDTTCVTP